MLSRARGSNDVKHRKYYADRGIGVCDRWLKFENFLEDMGERPEGKTLDRIKNDLGYSKDNCRWSTSGEQLRNTRRTKMITFEGETLCMKDWAKKIGISGPGLIGRLRRMPLEKALRRRK